MILESMGFKLDKGGPSMFIRSNRRQETVSIPSKYSHKYQTKKFFQNILLTKGHDFAFKKDSK